jgi:hypothetical protein
MLAYDTSGKRGVGWVSPSAKREPALHVFTTTLVVGPMARPVATRANTTVDSRIVATRCEVPRVDSPNG